MADISDVEQAVTNTVIACLYPAGVSESSVIGTLCRIYRGWPNAATLNADLSAGVVNVTIVTDNDSGRVTTRYLPEWQIVAAAPGCTVTVASDKVIIGGSPVPGDVVGVLVDGAAYVYRVAASDLPDVIAANLATLIQADRIALSSGSAVEIPGAAAIVARAVGDQSAVAEIRRQEKDIRIVCWCPGPSIRDTITAAIDAAMNKVVFLGLDDGTSARVVYKNTSSYDQSQDALLYRRDLVYSLEYPTVMVEDQPSMIFGAADMNGGVKYG